MEKKIISESAVFTALEAMFKAKVYGDDAYYGILQTPEQDGGVSYTVYRTEQSNVPVDLTATKYGNGQVFVTENGISKKEVLGMLMTNL